MTIFITQTDKNGKNICYRVTDGKKKKISSEEYTLHQETLVEDVLPIEASLSETESVIEVETPAIIETVNIVPEVKEDIPETAVVADAVITSFFDLVKSVAETVGQKSGELKLQHTKNYTLIKFKNFVVAALVVEHNNEISEVGFMGLTPETRKKITKCAIGEIIDHEDELRRQFVFINQKAVA